MDENRDDKQAAYERRRAEMMRLMERHLNLEATSRSLASEACVSRYHFHRVFRDVMGETPGDLQRRLRLERAANDLRQTRADVTTIAFDAGYASLEGFSRAFRRAYGQSPSQFRRRNSASPRLPGASHIHYDPQTLSLRTMQYGGKPMDLIDRLLDNDYRSKRNLLLSALRLTAAQLDAPLLCRVRLEPWWEPDGSLRQVLDRLTDMVWVAEMLKTIGWSHSGEGWTLDGQIRGANTIEEMIDRLDCFYKEYLPFVQYVKENDLWETTWVDAACEPAETFTYATVIEYGIERGIFRRFIAQGLLEQSGVAIR